MNASHNAQNSGSHGSCNNGAHGASKKKKLAEMLVDRVFRKTGSSFKVRGTLISLSYYICRPIEIFCSQSGQHLCFSLSGNYASKLFKVYNHLAEEDRAGGITLIVFLLSCGC